MSENQAPEPRRTARMTGAKLDATTIAAVLIPVAALLLALLVDTGSPAPVAAVSPSETELTRSTVVCPPGGREVDVASASGATGQVEVSSDGEDLTAEVAPETSTRVRVGRKAAVITGRDDLAPGLVATRFDKPLASVDCRVPQPDQWFTGAGAGGKHQSVLQLVNPDGGRALVDVVVLGHDGPVDVPALRGLAVRGGETRRFDLATTIPRRDDLALHVRTIRGRISASVLDQFRELGQGTDGRDSLAAQEAPSTANVMLGLPGGSGERTLVLANPGQDEGRATIRLVGADSVFTPKGVPEVVLPPESVVRVPLAPILRGAGANEDERPYGLQVESTVAATATLTMFVGGDLVESVPTPPLGGTATTPLPDAENTLVLSGAPTQGLMVVSLWDEDGTELEGLRVPVAPGSGYEVPLPRRARLMTVEPRRTTVSAVVLATGDGATLVRLREPVLTGLEPHVAPALE